MTKACDCINLMEEALKPHNVRLGLVLSLSGGPTRVGLQSAPIEKKRRTSRPEVLATFCPFCGIRYPESVS